MPGSRSCWEGCGGSKRVLNRNERSRICGRLPPFCVWTSVTSLGCAPGAACFGPRDQGRGYAILSLAEDETLKRITHRRRCLKVNLGSFCVSEPSRSWRATAATAPGHGTVHALERHPRVYIILYNIFIYNICGVRKQVNQRFEDVRCPTTSFDEPAACASTLGRNGRGQFRTPF